MNAGRTVGDGSGAPLSALKKPSSEEDWLSVVTETFTYLRNLKRGHEFHWREALLFLVGEQWIKWDNLTNKFFRHSLEDWYPTPITNYCAKFFDRLLDLLTSGDLKPGVRPATDDQRDIDASRISERILHFLDAELNSSDFRRRAAGWLILTGNTVLRGLWNPHSGHTTQLPRNKITEGPPILMPGVFCPACKTESFMGAQGQTCPSCGLAQLQMETRPLLNEKGEPLRPVQSEQERDEKGNPLFDSFKLGQVEELEVNPFKWFPEPKSDPKDVRYGVEAEIYPIDEIAEMFGNKARDLAPEDVEIYGWGNFLHSTLSSDYQLLQGSKDEQVAVVKWFRHIPSEKFPDGALCVVAGDRLLYKSKLEDYLDGKLPYRHVRYRVVPGELWGVGPIRDIIPLQKRLNAIDQSIVWNRKTMIHGQILEPKGAGIKTWDGRPALRIVWDWSKTGGHRPERLPGVPLPPSVIQERQFVIADMEDIIGTVEVLMGGQPSGVTTLGQTQILTEQALRRFTPIVRGWKQGLADHERRKLLIAKAMWDEPRVVKVIGENEDTEVYHYSGADIGNASDVFIHMENEVLWSQAMQEQKIIQLAERQWLGDMRSPEIRGKLLELLNVPGFVNEYSLDAKLARRRLAMIQRGAQGVTARSNDIHPIHFKILSDFTKTVEFERLPADQQQAISALMQQHQQAMQAEAQQAMMAAQATKGTGPETEGRVAQSGAFGGAPEAQAMETVPR